MKKYLRSTHDEYGNAKEFSAEAKEAWRTAADCGHMLLPDKALTVDEIIAEQKKYNEEFQEEAFNCSAEEIRAGLALLVEHGLAVEVEQ